MKTQDPVRWETLRRRSRVEDPGYHEGKNVILYSEAWCEALEEVIESNPGSTVWIEQIHRYEPTGRFVPSAWMESSEFGEALVLICSNWEYGDLFANGLTQIESKLYVEAVQRMTAAQQLAAQDTEKPQKHLA